MPDLQFAPNDPLIPGLIKERIESWQHRVPSSQFQQYGPIDRYLNKKFDGDHHMVKPQALFRPPIENDDDELLLEYGASDGPLPDNPEQVVRWQELRQEYNAGDISIDSTHQGYIRRRGPEATKRFPDFAVCDCGHAGQKDKVRIVFEIASISRTASETQIISARYGVETQMMDYLTFIGEAGDRWEGTVIGVNLIGISVAFILPAPDDDGYPWIVWADDDGHDNGWYSLYGPQFQAFMEQAKEQNGNED